MNKTQTTEFRTIEGIVLTEGMAYHTVNKLNLVQDKGVYWEGQPINRSVIYFTDEEYAKLYVEVHENKLSIKDMLTGINTSKSNQYVHTWKLFKAKTNAMLKKKKSIEAK
jgi:hypothetical protein